MSLVNIEEIFNIIFDIYAIPVEYWLAGRYCYSCLTNHLHIIFPAHYLYYWTDWHKTGRTQSTENTSQPLLNTEINSANLRLLVCWADQE